LIQWFELTRNINIDIVQRFSEFSQRQGFTLVEFLPDPSLGISWQAVL
jgi:hypothetical protein